MRRDWKEHQRRKHSVGQTLRDEARGANEIRFLISPSRLVYFAS